MTNSSGRFNTSFIWHPPALGIEQSPEINKRDLGNPKEMSPCLCACVLTLAEAGQPWLGLLGLAHTHMWAQFPCVLRIRVEVL